MKENTKTPRISFLYFSAVILNLRGILSFFLICGAVSSDASIETSADGITITRETARIRFVKKTCNIDQVTVLGSSLGDVPSPNIVYRDAHGMVYEQNHATDGQLTVQENESYIVIDATCHPKTRDGRTGGRLELRYKIRKADGLIRVSFSLGGDIKIGKLTAVHTIANIDANGIDKLYFMAPMKYRPMESHYVVCPPGTKKHYLSEKLNFACFYSGRIGFEIEQADYANTAIAADHEGYMRLESAGDRHLASLIFINQPAGAEFEVGDDYSAEYLFSFLPYHKPRPWDELFGGGLTDFIDINDLKGDIRVLANLGFTAVVPPGMYQLPNEPWRHQWYSDFIEECHRNGIKTILYYNLWNAYMKQIVESGLYPADGIKRDVQRHWPGQEIVPENYLTTAGDKRLPMCINAPEMKKFRLNQTFQIIDNYDLDGLFFDQSELRVCHNPLHGCSEKGRLTAAYADFYQQVREHLDAKGKQLGRDMLIVPHLWDRAGASVTSLADAVTPGEEGGFPSDAAFEFAYSSMCTGIHSLYLHNHIQCASIRTPKLYARALARCATVYPTYARSGWQEDVGVTSEELALWGKYMHPLRIFRASESDLHHPDDDNFSAFCRFEDDGITPVIYSRPDEMLLVIANEGSLKKKGDLHLSSGTLGLTGRDFILFDTLNFDNRELRAGDDNGLKLSINWPAADDARILLLKRRPDRPALIWHDVVTWRQASSWDGTELAITLSGVPDSTSRLVVYCADAGRPGRIEGGDMESYETVGRLASVAIGYDAKGKATLSLAFGSQSVELTDGDLSKRYEAARSIVARMLRSDYTKADLQELRTSLNTIRNLAHSAGRRRDEILGFAADAERILNVYQLLKEPLVTVLANEISKKNLVQAEWLVSGPFDNTRGSGAAIARRGCLGSNGVEFRARYRFVDRQAPAGTRFPLLDNDGWGGPTIHCKIEDDGRYLIYVYNTHREGGSNFFLPPGTENDYHVYKVSMDGHHMRFFLDGREQASIVDPRLITNLVFGIDDRQPPASSIETDWIKISYPEGHTESYDFDDGTIDEAKWERRWTGEIAVENGAVRLATTPRACSGFDEPYPPETSIDLTADYAGYENRKVRWRNVKGYFIDFAKLYRPQWGPRGYFGDGIEGDDMVAYALTYIHSPKAGRAWLETFTADGIKIWLNDREVLNRHEHLGQEFSEINHYKVAVDLLQGENKLLIKVDEIHYQLQRSQWKLMLKVTDGDGNRRTDISYGVPAVEPAAPAHDFYYRVLEHEE